jgi:predicted Holliday junction resolvase-like endonuclease
MFALWAIGVVAILFFVFVFGYLQGKSDLKDKHKRSKKFTRSVLGGLFSEQIAPFLPNFREDLKASEARFIGKPIDFLIFKGMDEQNITEVVFVEVKTGNSSLSVNERKLKEAIQSGNVSWYEYRVDKDTFDLKSEIT